MLARYHQIISLIFAVAYVVAIQLFASPQPVFRFLLPAVIIYLTALGLYNYYYLRAEHHFNIWTWLQPVLFFASWFLLLLLGPGEFIRGVILLAGLAVGFVIERFLGHAGEHF